jgi:uncharacterized membrane protein YbhN (UPF0104 family)
MHRGERPTDRSPAAADPRRLDGPTAAVDPGGRQTVLRAVSSRRIPAGNPSMLRRILSVTLLAAFLGWAGWYVATRPEAFAPLADVTWTDGLVLTLAFVLLMACNGVFIALVTSAFRIRLQTLEWLALSFASSFANYFLPFKGGTGIRALYMLHLHRFPITEFVSTLGIMYLMHVVVNGVMALVGMGLIATGGGPTNAILLSFFALVSLAGIVIILIDFEIGSHHERFPMRQLARVLAAWRTVRADRALVVKLWSLMLVFALATVWQCRAAFMAASITLSWDGVLVYAASKNLATLVSLTPGSLGVVELISIYLGSVLGYDTADALMVQSLIRAVAIVVLLLVGPFAMLYLRNKLRAASGTSPD